MTRVVYAIGDSLMLDGKPSSPLFHLPELMGGGNYFKSQGIGGDTSWQMLARLERDVLDQDPRPDTCIVLGGINDIQNEASSAAITPNLEAMYRMLLDAGVQPIALTIYPFGDHITWTPAAEATRQEIRAWMHTTLPLILPAVEVVDVEDAIGDLSDKNRPRIRAEYVDEHGIHTVAAGAAAVARALVEQARSLDGRGFSPGPGLSMS